jgi:metal-dependent hydrolase (beta-lactamase superfamily II)
LHYVKQLVLGHPIHTVVGRIYLIAADEARMDRTVADRRALGVQRRLPVHRTGFAAAARLWNESAGGVWTCPTEHRAGSGAIEP